MSLSDEQHATLYELTAAIYRAAYWVAKRLTAWETGASRTKATGSSWPGRKARTSPHIPGRKHEHPPMIRRDLIKMPKALRAEINDVVVKYAERKLRKDGSLDVAMMAHEMTQSLVDMIVEQEEHHHAPLFALMILSLGDEYLKRTGIAERRDN
jgi:hypothetical protein